MNIIWIVKLMDRKTGKPIETLYQGNEDNLAHKYIVNWYKNNYPEMLPKIIEQIDNDDYLNYKFHDGTDGVYAIKKYTYCFKNI